MSEAAGDVIVTDDLLQTTIAGLISGSTFAGDKVFTPRTWRTPADGSRWILIQSPKETKDNISGRAGLSDYDVTGVFRIVGRVSSKTDAGDAGAAAVQAAIGILKRQIEAAVINAQPLRRLIQQFVSVECVTATKTEGGLTLGELVMNLTLEYFQPSEYFAQPDADPFEEVAVYADLLNIYSPTGDFDASAEPFDVATASPRTAGPDGRPEAMLLIALPQPDTGDDGGGELDLSDPDNSNRIPNL